jgi:hypothetical protein
VRGLVPWKRCWQRHGGFVQGTFCQAKRYRHFWTRFMRSRDGMPMYKPFKWP